MLTITVKELYSASPCREGREMMDKLFEGYDDDRVLTPDDILGFPAEWAAWGIAEIRGDQKEESDRTLKTYAYLCVDRACASLIAMKTDDCDELECIETVKSTMEMCKDHLLGKTRADDMVDQRDIMSDLVYGGRPDGIDGNILSSVYHLVDDLVDYACIPTDFYSTLHYARLAAEDIEAEDKWQVVKLHEILTHPEMLFPCKEDEDAKHN